MHQNNNDDIITRLSKRVIKKNKVRNIFTIIAVAMTTFLIASVFTIGLSFLKNYQVMNTRASGTKATIYMSKPTENLIKRVKNTRYVDHVGIQINAGKINASGDNSTPLMYYDNTEWKYNYTPAISDVHGTYPIKSTEIMVSKEMLKNYSIKNPKVGMTIRLDMGKEGKKEFKLSGWFKNYKSFGDGGIPLILVSHKYCDEKGLSAQKDGYLSIGTERGKQKQVLDSLGKIKLSKGQKLDSTYDLNNDMNDALVVVAVIVVVIALFIVVSGYLLIFNIIYISVSKDIRFYGMLKTVGTTGKQLKKIIRKQIVRLSVIGVPVGIVVSMGAAFGLVPYAMSIFSTGRGDDTMPGVISFNPVIYVATIVFVILTLIISCHKPEKIASKVSPVEALKFTGSTSRVKKSKSSNGGKIYRMSFSNVFRDKKRAIVVFLSLFMGCITMLSFKAFIGCLDVNNFIDENVPHDFEYQNMTVDENVFNTDFIKKINSIDGITYVETVRQRYFSFNYSDVIRPLIQSQYDRFSEKDITPDEFINDCKKNKNYGCFVYCIGDDCIKRYNKDHTNKIDIDAFNKGSIFLFQCAKDSKEFDSMKGNKLSITNSESHTSYDMEIGGVLPYKYSDYAVLSYYTVGMPEGIYVSDKCFKNIAPNANAFYINIDCDKDKEAAIKNKLKSMNNSIPADKYLFDSKTDSINEFKSTMMTMDILVVGISIMLLTIGIMNFINVTITNVYSRKTELAIMESVGMTKKQLLKMLVYEGAYYAIITSVLILTLGTLIMNVIGKYTVKVVSYGIYSYPIVTVIALIASLFVICLVVPVIVYKATSKETISERIRSK